MLTIRGRRVVCPDGERPASIRIDGGRIVSIGALDDAPAGDVIDARDAGDLVVSPGIVDTHVHVNEPGRTEWEGFDTATRAAAAGGVTTIVDMPLNSVPATTTVSALEAKRDAARGRCHVDVAFWGGVVPGNEGDVEPLVDAGVRGFKCFLVPSGVDEFEYVDADTLGRAMPILSRRGVPLLVHAELPEYLRPFRGAVERYRDFEATRPAGAEAGAIYAMAQLAEDTGAHVHVVHVSSADGVAALAGAQASGVRMSGETCPHYLTMTDADVPDGATEFKCAPPIRTDADRDALWRALESGTLALVATDHSPAPPVMKCPGDFSRAWGGIASLELSLAVVWTQARLRGRTPADLARWMSEAPAALAGLAGRKGAIAVGADADVVIWDPDGEFTVDPSVLQQRHKLTPYAHRRLQGVVHETFVRGERVWSDRRLTRARWGQLL
jgi:allantoinase